MRATPPAATIAVSLNEVYTGETFTVRWSSTDAASCDLSSSEFAGGRRDASGEEVLGPVEAEPGEVVTVQVRCGKATATATARVVKLRPKGEPGVFDLSCAYSHTLSDDPIAFPRRAGASHLHDFFGARGTNAFASFASLSGRLEQSPIPTSCSEDTGEVRNMSAYWFPALLRSGKPIRPHHAHIYYRHDGAGLYKPARSFPPGFVMIAGPFKGPDDGGDLVYFCRSPRERAQWDRLNPHCVGERTIHAMLSFPTCWDGRVDSADHRSHLAYGSPCPETHRIKLPRILVIVHYRLEDRMTKADMLADWRLSSGPLSTYHGDYLFAWDQFVLDRLIHDCLNTRIDCKRKPPRG